MDDLRTQRVYQTIACIATSIGSIAIVIGMFFNIINDVYIWLPLEITMLMINAYYFIQAFSALKAMNKRIEVNKNSLKRLRRSNPSH